MLRPLHFVRKFCLFPYQGKFAAAPTVLVTADHISSAYKHDAASLWVENATNSSFYICLRELQNYDGLHEDIFVVCWFQVPKYTCALCYYCIAVSKYHKSFFPILDVKKYFLWNSISVGSKYRLTQALEIRDAKTKENLRMALLPSSSFVVVVVDVISFPNRETSLLFHQYRVGWLSNQYIALFSPKARMSTFQITVPFPPTTMERFVR